MKSSKKELVSVRIPKELNQKFTEHVAAMGISKTAFILNFINKEIISEKTNPLVPTNTLNITAAQTI